MQHFTSHWSYVSLLPSGWIDQSPTSLDKASVNRKIFRMHQSNSSEVTFKVPNPYSSDGRFIYFISDIPHLIKTMRNCWSNSFGHSYKRALWVWIQMCMCIIIISTLTYKHTHIHTTDHWTAHQLGPLEECVWTSNTVGYGPRSEAARSQNNKTPLELTLAPVVTRYTFLRDHVTVTWIAENAQLRCQSR